MFKKEVMKKVLNYENVNPERYFIHPDGTIYDYVLSETVEVKTRKDGVDVVKLATTDGKLQNFIVNRLVGFAFVKKTVYDKKHGRNMIHPIDWDKSNHDYKNLQWVNNEELLILVKIKNQYNDFKQLENRIIGLLKKEYTPNEIRKMIPILSITYIKELQSKNA